MGSRLPSFVVFGRGKPVTTLQTDSDLTAGKHLTLTAEGEVKLLGAANTASQRSNNTSFSASTLVTLQNHTDDFVGNISVSRSTSNVVKTIEIKAGQVIHLALSTSGRTWTANVLDGSSARDAIVEDFNALSGERVLE